MMRTALFFLLCAGLTAQAPSASTDETLLDLMELLNTPVSVASKKASTIREQPGIVSLVTRQDIQASGARDLIDILNLLPGFAFACDVQGVVGAAARGVWAYEGKFLLLVDGQEYNDPLYGTTQLGNHLPVDLIQRVEIIRGPGSAIYGGNAELAVINVITRTGEDLKGGYLGAGYGAIQGTSGHPTVSAAYGGKFKNGQYSVSFFHSSAPRSHERYTDWYGTAYDLSKESALKQTFSSVGVEWMGYQARLLLDKYSVDHRDGYGDVVPNLVTQTWDNYYIDLKKAFKLSDTLTLTPNLQFRRQFPWGAQSQNFGYSNKRIDRTMESLQLAWDPSPLANLVFGAESYQQKGKASLAAWREGELEGYFYGPGQRTAIDYHGSAFYAQGLFQTPFVNVTLGARYETHSLYESSFVPRLALTKVIDRFHFKALISKAFRAPAMESININAQLKPEKTTAIELEAGYQLSSKSFLSLNLVQTSVQRPIIYFVENDDDAYANFEQTGSRALELEYKLQHALGQLNFNYSYYEAHENKVDLYRVLPDEKAYLAFPRHKLVLHSTFRLGKGFSLFASAVYLGDRYGWNYNAQSEPDENGYQSSLQKFKSTTLVNLNINWKTPIKGLELSLGAYNALKQDFSYIQAYYSPHSPIPGQPQEFSLKGSYSF